jgi:glycerol dehydrogenase
MRTAVFPGRYVQGAGVLKRFGVEAARLGHKVLMVVDNTLPPGTLDGFNAEGVTATRFNVNPACTEAAIGVVSGNARQAGVDMIAGFGGGKVIDLGRASADDLGLPYISVPTVAASDAPCSSLSVIYDSDDRVVQDRFVRKNPDLVLVDSVVIAKAPARFFSAGMGDALATFYEADACRRAGAANLCGGKGSLLAHAAARLCLDTVLEKGPAALAACRQDRPSSEFEDVLEATILLSGLGFESGGVAAAHAFHHGLADIAETHGALHGEKVAFGVLAELALNDRSDAEILELARFNQSVALPVTLADLGIDDAGSAIPRIAARATRPREIIHNEPMPVDQALAEAALRRADQLGRRMGR